MPLYSYIVYMWYFVPLPPPLFYSSAPNINWAFIFMPIEFYMNWNSNLVDRTGQFPDHRKLLSLWSCCFCCWFDYFLCVAVPFSIPPKISPQCTIISTFIDDNPFEWNNIHVFIFVFEIHLLLLAVSILIIFTNVQMLHTHTYTHWYPYQPKKRDACVRPYVHIL